MSREEQERMRRISQNGTLGNQAGGKLIYDPATKTIRYIGGRDPDTGSVVGGPKDFGFSCDQGREPLSDRTIRERMSTPSALSSVAGKSNASRREHESSERSEDEHSHSDRSRRRINRDRVAECIRFLNDPQNAAKIRILREDLSFS